MNIINIKIIYRGYTSRILRDADFPVDPFEYEIDPNKEAARITLQWLKQIRREGHIDHIISVIYNSDKDITELVKELDSLY
jgi:hypothetical protein